MEYQKKKKLKTTNNFGMFLNREKIVVQEKLTLG